MCFQFGGSVRTELSALPLIFLKINMGGKINLYIFKLIFNFTSYKMNNYIILLWSKETQIYIH